MLLRTRAPAKVNLTLHVVGRRASGYHELVSLVAFAGVGDILTLAPDETPGLVVEGPTALAAGPDADNLVLKATRALAERVPGLRTGAFRLVKHLPVGAGIGGGSSDAAAALRLLGGVNGLSRDDPRLADAARATGADVLVCLDPRIRMMRGTGDEVGPPRAPPGLFAVLVNPGVPLETRAVFAAMGLDLGVVNALGDHPKVEHEVDPAALLRALARGRNDMEAAARALAPAVAEVLASLAAAPACRLTRMSGSGSTCFGLFATRHEAAHAASAIRREHAEWWVRATALR